MRPGSAETRQGEENHYGCQGLHAGKGHVEQSVPVPQHADRFRGRQEKQAHQYHKIGQPFAKRYLLGEIFEDLAVEKQFDSDRNKTQKSEKKGKHCIKIPYRRYLLRRVNSTRGQWVASIDKEDNANAEGCSAPKGFGKILAVVEKQ